MGQSQGDSTRIDLENTDGWLEEKNYERWGSAVRKLPGDLRETALTVGGAAHAETDESCHKDAHLVLLRLVDLVMPGDI